MSVTSELASSVQLCFVLFEVSGQADICQQDVAVIGEVAAALQPVLLRTQKAILHSDDVPEDGQLLNAVASVHSSLQGLQEAAAAARAHHWLLRVLLARDVRHQLAAAFKTAAAALDELEKAAACLLDDSQLQQLSNLQARLLSRRPSKADHLETLARGLMKHILDERTDTEQLPAMLKFTVREASKHSTIKAASNGSTAGSSSSSSSGSSRYQSSPGETSLTDTQLLLTLQQLAAERCGSEQLALYQIVSILEGLKDAKRHERHRRRQQQQQRHLQRVSEAGEGADFSISSRAAADDDTINPPDQEAAVGSSSRGSRGTSGEQAFNVAVSQTMSGLEEMLLADPHDTVALTQLLEMLLQVETAAAEACDTSTSDDGSADATADSSAALAAAAAEDAQVAAAVAASTSSAPQAQVQQNGSKSSKLKQFKTAARAALLLTKTTSKRYQKQVDDSAALAAAAAAEAAAKAAEQERQLLIQQHKQAWADRVHQLASAALDALLRLTPQPAGVESFVVAGSSTANRTAGSSSTGGLVIPGSRDGVCTEAGHSLALGLLSHPDTVVAITGCLWAWPDIAVKAARLLTLLVQSGPAVTAAQQLDCRSDKSDASQPYTSFCKMLCGSEYPAAAAATGSTSKLWGGLVHLLYIDNPFAAAVAAEAVAAVGSSRDLVQFCTGPAAVQLKDQLVLLLLKHEQQPGAAGAAAAALHALADPTLRPAMHRVLVSSFWESLGPEISATAEARVRTLCSTLIKVLHQGSDALAACRAAQLLVLLVSDVNWNSRSSDWVQCFKAAQALLAAGISRQSSSGSSNMHAVESSRIRSCGAALVAALVGDRDLQQQKLPPMLAAHLDSTEQNELLLQVLEVSLEQFSISGSWQGLGSQDCWGPQRNCRPLAVDDCKNECLAAVQLLGRLLGWLPAEVCVMPELHEVALPVIEHVCATEHGLVQQLAWQAQRQILG